MLISAIAGGDRGIRTPDLCHDMTVVLHPSSPFSLNLYSLYYTFFTGLTESGAVIAALATFFVGLVVGRSNKKSRT
jgi:hypothetical protein